MHYAKEIFKKISRNQFSISYSLYYDIYIYNHQFPLSSSDCTKTYVKAK